jgi:hypothetical protein
MNTTPPVFKIYYYTFLDVICNDYTMSNKNFFELSKTQNYFILTSGNINNIRYDEYLKNKGISGHFIHSDKNSYPVKFNLFKKYLEQNKEQYQNCIFCKIDTDLVHYKIKSFHAFLNNEFSVNKRYFIGNEKEYWIRGGLNAIHVDSILDCPPLCEDRWDDFDGIFTTTLVKNNIIIKRNIMLFNKSTTLLPDKFGTHVYGPNKLKEVLNLNDELYRTYIDIYQ